MANPAPPHTHATTPAERRHIHLSHDRPSRRRRTGLKPPQPIHKNPVASKIPVRAVQASAPRSVAPTPHTPLHPLTRDILVVHLPPHLDLPSRSALSRVSKPYRAFFLPIFYDSIRLPPSKHIRRVPATRIPVSRRDQCCLSLPTSLRPSANNLLTSPLLRVVKKLTLTLTNPAQRELVYTAFTLLGTRSRLELCIFNPRWVQCRKAGGEFEPCARSKAYEFYSRLKALVMPQAAVCKAFAWVLFDLSRLLVLHVGDGIRAALALRGVSALTELRVSCQFPWYWHAIRVVSGRPRDFPGFRRVVVTLKYAFFVPAREIGRLWAESLDAGGSPRWRLAFARPEGGRGCLFLSAKDVRRLLLGVGGREYPGLVRPWEFFVDRGLRMKAESLGELAVLARVLAEFERRVSVWELVEGIGVGGGLGKRFPEREGVSEAVVRWCGREYRGDDARGLPLYGVWYGGF